MDVKQIYLFYHFTIYTNIESLCCTPETSIMYVNYTSNPIKSTEK